MTKSSSGSFFYRLSRIFWSIYFVLTIGLVGLVAAYILAVVLFTLSFLTKPVMKMSLFFRYTAEYVMCFAIRFLLSVQPWLRCEHNFPGIYGFFDRYQTRKVMFVGNHLSNLDTFIMISLVPGLHGLAKHSLFYNIFFAPIMLLSGFIPTEKGNLNSYYHGLRQLKTKVLDRNRAVLIFPETTRAPKSSDSIGKFSVATFDVAIDAKAILVPVFIHGTDEVMGRGDLFLNPYHPIEIKLLDAIDAKEYTSAADLSKHVWNLLSREQKNRMDLCS